MDDLLTGAAYRRPDFTRPELATAPDAEFERAPGDGVMPERFFSTTNLPTYLRISGEWLRARRPRMDCVIVVEDGVPMTCEPRDVMRGTPVAMGEEEDGSEGVLVVQQPFTDPLSRDQEQFQFMSSDVSRERPVNYERLARMLVKERDRGGHLVWVIGPALVHARAREDMIWFIEQGFVGAVLAGNAVAVHDIEAALYGTTLGMTSTGDPASHGHALHVRAINRVRQLGSIREAVRSGAVQQGIMYALETCEVPYVLTGSIRDDGPLPGVITDVVESQRAMREHTSRATVAVLVATALHAIAVGNMLPAFVDADSDDDVRPLQTICVDQTEFIVNKLRDRGTHQAHGVVTNAQDFMHILRLFVEQWTRPSA